MREIKFRAQQFNHGKHGFQYGSYATDNKNYHAILKADVNDDECMVNALINNETLGQFTGLKDKNGVDIYEGDVLLIEYNHLGKVTVEFIDGAFNIARYRIDKTKVIGNIHENKELLRG